MQQDSKDSALVLSMKFFDVQVRDSSFRKTCLTPWYVHVGFSEKPFWHPDAHTQDFQKNLSYPLIRKRKIFRKTFLTPWYVHVRVPIRE